MIRGLIILLGFQGAGEIVSRLFSLPIPGPVIGLVLLLTFLIRRGKVDAPIDTVASALVKNLGVLFVPAIADAFFAIWEEIDDALTPIIGSQGVVALYRRTVRLCLTGHPWLAGGLDGERSASDPKIFKSVLASRGSDDAIAGGSVFLGTFHDLLGSLVGPSLTERLLRSVWTNSPSGTAAQDT